MPRRSLTIEQIRTLLAETPPRIAALTAGLPLARLHTAPKDDEWSANDVLAHLRACSDVWGNNILAIVAEDTPTLRGVNPRAWIKNTDYVGLDFRPSFRSYVTQRADLLAVLEALPPEGWSHTATVTGMVGEVFVRSVLYYAESLARHEQSHVKQIERTVNSRRLK